ncbi:hypothetical protein BJX63DRAFT_421692 [Aspergillus granulosus]|uniref:Xylanolytic transcriptional activator regulatory domain-containing protein n=1 Tax=Aspergillus granulosus TaxID=176169 RepID=A0ABR4HB00_9EURO
MQDRIDQLESLVLDLMHQTEPDSRKRALLPPDSQQANILSHETPRDGSLCLSDYGSFRTPETGANYVSSSHWAAILDSITDLRNYLAWEEEVHPRVLDPVRPSTACPKPQLFYSCPLHKSSVSILKALPPRATVDRLISRYFNVLDIAPGVVHSGTFLREAFSNPVTTSPTIAHSTKPSHAEESQTLVDSYKEKAIQCLLLGHYTKGGPYVLETLILYFLIENFHLKDMEIGIWVLVGNIVQIAIHMGYHRDARHFSSISPFAGEMRRRVWAMIVQLDYSVSTQLGLPRLVKESKTDTAEPRNLHDSDFDENTAELPASKPETEVTPTLYVLAKLRLLSVGAKVVDVTTDVKPRSYAEILVLDQQIDEAQNNLPSSLKWAGLASSLNVPSHIPIQRIWLEVIVQQLKIVLHRNRWRVSSAFITDFLLATSVLCFYFQTHNNEHDPSKNSGIEMEDVNKIRNILKTSRVIWSHQCATSREARKAVATLNYVLGDTQVRPEQQLCRNVLPQQAQSTAVSYFPGYSDFLPNYEPPSPGMAPALEGMTWPIFTAKMNSDIEQWLDMDMSS